MGRRDGIIGKAGLPNKILADLLGQLSRQLAASHGRQGGGPAHLLLYGVLLEPASYEWRILADR